MTKSNKDPELFVIEEKSSAAGRWMPLPDAYTTAKEGQYELREKMKRGGFAFKRLVVYRPAGEVVIFRCESCDNLSDSAELPEGWTQTGKSKFPYAPGKLGAYCPRCSKKG